MGSRRNTSPDPYWGEFDPSWPNPDQELLRRARMPFSSLPGLQEHPIPWTEEPDLYRPRQETRRRSPERNTETSRYRPIRSQPLEHNFDHYGPSNHSERRRQPSPSPAPTSRAYHRGWEEPESHYGYSRREGSRPATDRDIRNHYHSYRETEGEREGYRARGRREASRERRRREEEYERGRRDRSSGGGGSGGSWRRRASRWLDTAFDAAVEGASDWLVRRYSSVERR